MDEKIEVLEENETTEVETTETIGSDISEMLEDNKETGSALVIGEETELVVLQRIDDSLNHIDSVVEYGVSLLIIFMLILILNYIYKFFKMFF